MAGVLSTLLCVAIANTGIAAPVTAGKGDREGAVASADPWVRTDHAGTIGGRAIRYESTAGTIGLRDERDIERGRMFFVAYSLPQPAGSPPRPVTFFFNGGPGSSTIWLHMGAFAPVRLRASQPGKPLAPPFVLADNRFSLLDKSDLVFLDAVGTGFSRAADAGDNRRFWGNDQDADSFAQAIARYLTATGRWNAPKFLFGESYGTMRAANLAPRLHERGIDLSGIILMSTILNFGHFAPGLDQAAIDLLPTYAATAYYHGRIAKGDGDLPALLDRARDFARGRYAAALARGDLIDPAERAAVAAEMSRLIGLSAAYIERSGLRIGLDAFRRQLLLDRSMNVGAMDTRYAGRETEAAGALATYDPSDAQVKAAFASVFDGYVRSRLNYRTDLDYVLGDSRAIMGAWDWSHRPAEGEKQNSLANSVPDLAVAMRRMPRLKVLALNGYYDLMTPFFGAEFDLARLGLGAESHDRVQLRYYPSGHIIYLDDAVMPALRGDIGAFYETVLRDGA
ncbi:S10 family peptidase [Sphingomonas colocasiae]|uniref:Peptidase S10 n=1 Tax=Sphingomonas colocasiae TaxID=1848973 RepID=A0ABS7PM76_9SPHN|nr:peptidase S10 [Sphingomonas colocasiae]MBY8822358.1 peptidase S10 [Sphingomonas colocasiae]